MATDALPDDEHPEVVELPAGFDLAGLEVVVARLTSDGIESRIEPQDVGSIPDEDGYRLLLRRSDLAAAREVLEAAAIDLPDDIELTGDADA